MLVARFGFRKVPARYKDVCGRVFTQREMEIILENISSYPLMRYLLSDDSRSTMTNRSHSKTKKDHLVASNVYQKQKTTNRQRHNNGDASENSLSSTDTMDVSVCYSATERGYMTDVSDSASPTGRRNIVSPTRRRMKCSDTNLNRKSGKNGGGGSYTDSEDENENARTPHRFERKPPKSKSRRREKLSLQETRQVPVSKRHSYDPTKRNSYDPTKRFSWTDSGISSSIGTGPNTMKSMYSESIPTSIVHLEKIRDKEPVPSLEDVVGDTCNAVNELKDLQISIRKAKLEHNSQKSLAKSNSLNSPYHNYYSNSSRPLSMTSIDRNHHSEVRRAESTPCKQNGGIDDVIVGTKRENKRRSQLYENLSVFQKEDTIEEEKDLTNENIDTRPLPPYPGTHEDRTKNCTDKEGEIIEKEQENEGKLHKQLSTTSTKTNKNKGIFKGLRKVFKTKSVPPHTTKDVTNEFSFEKRKIDEDTLKEFHTITTKFRNEVKYLQNISIDDLDQTKMALDEENIQNILLDQLTFKPNKNLTFLQRMFGRSKSYKATKPLKKTKNTTKSLSDNTTRSGHYDANTLPLTIENGLYGKKQKNENSVNMHHTLGNNNNDFSNDDDNTIKTNSLQTIKNESNCNSFRTSSRMRNKTCTLSTKGDSCLKHRSFSSLSPNEESFIENKRCTISSRSEYSKQNTEERRQYRLHHGRHVNDHEIDSVKSGASSNKLLRAQSLLHMRATASEKHDPFPKKISINLHNQVHSFSSSDILGGTTPNNCDVFSSDCDECAYSDYLDFLQFRRFRKNNNSRCDRYNCRLPKETYDDNGYGTYTDYTDHHCACASENSSSWYMQQKNQIKEHSGPTTNPIGVTTGSGNGGDRGTKEMASYGTYV